MNSVIDHRSGRFGEKECGQSHENQSDDAIACRDDRGIVANAAVICRTSDHSVIVSTKSIGSSVNQ